MSDEYEPSEVVESDPEPEAMPADPEAQASVETAPPVDETVVAEAVEMGAESTPNAPSPTDADDSAPPPADEAVVEPETQVVDDAVPAVTGATSTVVSIADLESSPTKAARSGPNLTALGSVLAGRGWIVGAVLAVLVIIFLFLPPISLGQRIAGGRGYTVLDGDTTSVEHPDGLVVSRADDASGKLRVKLSSVPRADFVSGEVEDDLAAALEALPAGLTPKSPYYAIDVKSKDPVAGRLRVVIPNEAEPWETLDLYAWNPDEGVWSWLPAQLDRTSEMLAADVASLPAGLVAVQNEGAAPKVLAEVETWPADVAAAGVDGASVAGMLIGTMGGTTGYADQLPAADGAGLVPTVRNWVPDRPENWALVSDMLKVEADRTAHVANLLSVAQAGGYPGLVVDYRSVQAQDKALFSQFVAELAAALHGQDLWLGLVVDSPEISQSGGWVTGGYDLQALGAEVDQLRVSMPVDPAAYAPGGEAEALIQWAATQVARTKLMPVYSTLSTDGQQPTALAAVLASLGQISVAEPVTESVVPGTSVNLSLGQIGVLEDAATRATSVSVGDGTYWLGTPQWLRSRLDLASRYRLGGVVVRDLFSEGNLPGLVPAIADFKAAGAGVAGSLPSVVWSVTDPAGQASQSTGQFTQPSYEWTAPEAEGTYRIGVTVGGVDKGVVEFAVAAPVEVVTDTLAAGEVEEPDATEDGDVEAGDAVSEGDETDDTLQAAFVADVSVPDNTQFDKGASFTKTWSMKNSGQTDWPEDTVFVFASDTQLGDASEVEVGAVGAGKTVDISVEMVAPDEDGTYKSTWQLEAGDAAIAGGAAYVQIVVGEPVAAPPAVAAPVATGSFELGAHIRDLGLPYHDKMRYAGMTWIKTQIFFGQDAAGMVAAAHNNGYKIQLSAIGGAAMVNEAGYEEKFAAWVATLAAAGADAIEVWNEPNIDREWQIGLISPASYTNLLCKSYAAIKAANGGTAVISAAPSPTGWFGGCGPNGCDDRPWIEGLWNAGAVNCLDYIGAHHNAGATSPSARIGHPANPGDTHHSWFFLPQTELYFNTFQGTRQLFYTEMGYASQEGVPTFSDQFAWARGITNAQQAAWLAEAVSLGSSTGMVKSIVVWNIDFVRYGTDPQDGFAIIRPGGGCPACETLHNVLGSR